MFMSRSDVDGLTYTKQLLNVLCIVQYTGRFIYHLAFKHDHKFTVLKITLKSNFWRKNVKILSLCMQRCYGRQLPIYFSGVLY